jgi:hypothetical protein
MIPNLLSKQSTLTLCAAFLAAVFSSSCVSTKNIKLSSSDRSAMNGKTFVVTSREMPKHAVIKQSAMAAGSLGGAIGGAIVGAVAEEEGKDQIEKHRIEDPNLKLTQATAKTLMQKTGAKQITNRSKTSALDPQKVASQNPGADYVLDCFTTSWTGLYYPFSIGKYFLTYGAKMQLVETASGRVVAEGFHVYQGKDKANAPDYDGIYSNGAAFLKSETNKGVDGAIAKFADQF